MKIVVDTNKCRASGNCVVACPVDAITIVNGAAVIDHDRCDLDGICIPACPHQALDFDEK
ncbi:MAG: 4Fe-4S binding protein [Desulfuromonadaceae bacterium]|nr:4Fe-4S binding protein [Desulfuromonadaceae bacterium]